MKARRNLIVVGDRVLIEPDERTGKTVSGLYLPPTVKEKEKVVGGLIVKIGPGYPVHDPNTVIEEPWSAKKNPDIKYIPLQASEGDYALFLKDAAIEIEFEAILALVRTEIEDDLQNSEVP